MPQNQHFVHRSYLAGWADAEKHVMLYRKQPAYMRRRAIRGILSGQDILNVVDPSGNVVDDTERFWSEIESDCGEHLREVRRDRQIENEEQRLSILKTAALHWARGESIRGRSLRIAGEAVDHRYYGLVDRIAELEAVYRSDFGHDPMPGEVEGIIAEMFTEYLESNKAVVNSMLNMYEKFVDWGQDKSVEILVAPSRGQGFSTSDSPVVHLNRTTGQVGHDADLALGDADLILMPLGRRLACTFTLRASPPLLLNNQWVDTINKDCIWAGAAEHIVAHPHEHPGGVVPCFSDWAASLDN